jgi:lipoprotein-anchoring transpeptidase ErfK/SrfK
MAMMLPFAKSRRFHLSMGMACLLAAMGGAARGQGGGAAAGAAQPSQLQINVAWQIALEGADFSPGIIDGVFKRKGLMALSEYGKRYFPAGVTATNLFDPQVYLQVQESLKLDVFHAFVPYTITAEDAAQVGGTLPEDWNAKARLKRLDYESLIDCIAEKFHCTRGLLELLNSGVNMDTLVPGQTLQVPNIRPFPAENKQAFTKRGETAASVVVNLGEKTIRLFDKSGNQMALFHCSIAKDKAKLPDRDTKIQTIAAPNPNYTFRPEMWPEVHNVNRVLTIPPGPRNPIGAAWCSLDLPGYGIHGVPKPELIGKTGSHGCFRLTNWDALKFAMMVREGIPVKIINPEREAAAEVQ